MYIHIYIISISGSKKTEKYIKHPRLRFTGIFAPLMWVLGTKLRY